MTIVNKILSSFDSSTVVLYGSAFDINSITESIQIGDRVIVLLQEVIGSTLIYEPLQHGYCEQSEVMLFFITLSQYDRDSLANEELVEKCRNKLVQWLLQFSVQNSDIRLKGDIRLQRVYDKTDSILTGLCATLTVREDIGAGVCGEGR